MQQIICMYFLSRKNECNQIISLFQSTAYKIESKTSARQKTNLAFSTSLNSISTFQNLFNQSRQNHNKST